MATLTEQLILISFAGARPTLERAMLEELRASMSAYYGAKGKHPISSNDVDVLYATLNDLTERAVENLQHSGYRLAEEALQRLHYLILEVYVSAIERNTRLLSGFQPDLLDRIEEFISRLKEQVAFRYRHIEPPDFERVVRIPIEDLYVTPSLSEGIEPSLYQGRALDLGDFSSRIYRSVVLGDPGGGKSTLSAFLAHAIANGSFAQDTFGGKTPLIIVLREVKIYEQGPESIFQYLEAICQSTYALRPPSNALDYALLNGRLFLIFDGLDELLEPTSRAKVVASIEAIANLYPDVPIMVTSRRISYNAAPLDPAIFDSFSLNEFDDNRIELYAYRSFVQLEDKSEDECKKIARSFLRESREHAAEIRSNPLLLALMCRLYRGESYIPQNVPALYQRCADMLFFTWDQRRHIDPGLPFEYHLEPLMAYLAYNIFEKSETALRESIVIQRAQKYLQEWLIPDPPEAKAVATTFVKYFKDRLWVFNEVSLAEDGESLYAFTHRTFLEYFAGKYVSTSAASSAELATRLLPRLKSRQWDIVAQVAVYLRTKAEMRAADEIIHYLLSVAVTEEESDGDLIAFVNRLLTFVVPRPETLSQVVSVTLDYVIKQATHGEMFDVWPLVMSLARTRSDNRPGISRSVETYIEDVLNQPHDIAIFAVATILQLPEVLEASFVGDSSYVAELGTFWQAIANIVSDIAGESIREWARADKDLALTAWRLKVLTLKGVIEYHGISVLDSVASELFSRLSAEPSDEVVHELEEWHDVVVNIDVHGLVVL